MQLTRSGSDCVSFISLFISARLISWQDLQQQTTLVGDHLVLSSSIVLSPARPGRAPVPLLPPLIETMLGCVTVDKVGYPFNLSHSDSTNKLGIYRYTMVKNVKDLTKIMNSSVVVHYTSEYCNG